MKDGLSNLKRNKMRFNRIIEQPRALIMRNKHFRKDVRDFNKVLSNLEWFKFNEE